MDRGEDRRRRFRSSVSSRWWLDSDLVVHREAITVAEVAPRGLGRDVAEGKLNLFEFASSLPP